MSQPQPLILGRRRTARPKRSRRSSLSVVLARTAPAGPPAAYPGYGDPGDDGRTGRFVTGSLLLHGLAFALLALLASLAPVIEERIIPVQILREEPAPPPEPLEPLPAPKVLAQRRNLPFAPAVQAVQPQIVNPHIVAEASPAVLAETLQMDAVGTAPSAPTEVAQRATVVERVSAVNTAVRARVSAVDVAAIASPAVRGPTRIDAPVGPSVGPRRVEAAAVGDTIGTARQIGNGNGSSVRDGVLSDRDVVGSPDGALVVSVDTSLGNSRYAGTAPGGSGGGQVAPPQSCLEIPAVQSYLGDVTARVKQRWILPPGVNAGLKVTLRFQLDVAGSPSRVSIVSAEDNALGASAVDALRAAAPFPPMPEDVRCLANLAITGRFSNPVGG